MLPITRGPRHRRVPPERFDIPYDSAPAVVRRLLALRPDTAVVTVGDGMLDVRFGRCRLSTPLTNLAEFTLGLPRANRSTLGVGLSPCGRVFTVGTAGEGVAGGPVRVRFRRPVSVTAPAVVLRVGSLLIATTRPDALLETMSLHVRPMPGRSVH